MRAFKWCGVLRSFDDGSHDAEAPNKKLVNDSIFKELLLKLTTRILQADTLKFGKIYRFTEGRE